MTTRNNPLSSLLDFKANMLRLTPNLPIDLQKIEITLDYYTSRALAESMAGLFLPTPSTPMREGWVGRIAGIEFFELPKPDPEPRVFVVKQETVPEGTK